jgi:hypothetical protein
MRLATALAILLVASPCLADETPQIAAPQSGPQSSPLAPGKPAGVEQANNHELFIYISVGMIALALGGVALTYLPKGSSSTPATSQ